MQESVLSFRHVGSEAQIQVVKFKGNPRPVVSKVRQRPQNKKLTLEWRGECVEGREERVSLCRVQSGLSQWESPGRGRCSREHKVDSTFPSVVLSVHALGSCWLWCTNSHTFTGEQA